MSLVCISWHHQVPELPIYGVAIPTVAGLHLVLDILEAKSSHITITLCCLICVRCRRKGSLAQYA